MLQAVLEGKGVKKEMLAGHFTTCAEISEREKEREREGGDEERDHLTPDSILAQLQ